MGKIQTVLNLLGMLVILVLILSVVSTIETKAQTPTIYEVWGVLRPDVNGNWYLLNDSGHEPHNVSSIVQTTNSIRVNYTETCSQVHYTSTDPDETLTVMDIDVGTRGSFAYALIFPAKAGSQISTYSITNTGANIWFYMQCEI